MRIVTTWAVLLLALCGPAAAQHGPWIAAADTESHLAEVVIRSDGGRVLVMLDTVLDAGSKPDGFTDRWSILQTHERSHVAAYFERALVVLTSTSVRVSETSGQRYDFVLAGSDRPAGVDSSITRVEGFGLAHFKAATDVPLAADAVALASMGEWRFSDGEACLSGGPGATKCSTADARFACAVACATGYEACCGQRAAVCGCRKEDDVRSGGSMNDDGFEPPPSGQR